MPKDTAQLVRRLEQALLGVNKIAAARLFRDAGLSTVDFAEAIMVPALERIGAAWEQGSVALSQVYMSGRICEGLLDQHMSASGHRPCAHPPMAIALLIDSHALGKRMVYSIMRASGFDLLDYGEVDLDALVARVEKDGISILLVSALMLSSALQVRALRERLDALGLKVKLVVGGAPFRLDPNLWREVGADATSATASGTVAVVRQLAGL